MVKKRSKKTAKEIVEEVMPGMEIIEKPARPTPDPVRRATKPGPTMAALRKKYLGSDAEEDDYADAAEESTEDEDDVEVKLVRRKQSPADPADDPGPRLVIISKKKGIIGYQG